MHQLDRRQENIELKHNYMRSVWPGGGSTRFWVTTKHIIIPFKKLYSWSRAPRQNRLNFFDALPAISRTKSRQLHSMQCTRRAEQFAPEGCPVPSVYRRHLPRQCRAPVILSIIIIIPNQFNGSWGLLMETCRWMDKLILGTGLPFYQWSPKDVIANTCIGTLLN